LAKAGVLDDRLPAGDLIDRGEVLTGAIAESRRCGAPYVGTEHILLAMARRPGSVLPGCGATADSLSELLAAAGAGGRRAHPPLAVGWGAAVGGAGGGIRSRG